MPLAFYNGALARGDAARTHVLSMFQCIIEGQKTDVAPDALRRALSNTEKRAPSQAYFFNIGK